MGEITFVLEIGEESNCPVPIQVQISTCEADVVFIDTWPKFRSIWEDKEKITSGKERFCFNFLTKLHPLKHTLLIEHWCIWIIFESKANTIIWWDYHLLILILQLKSNLLIAICNDLWWPPLQFFPSVLFLDLSVSLLWRLNFFSAGPSYETVIDS